MKWHRLFAAATVASLVSGCKATPPPGDPVVGIELREELRFPDLFEGLGSIWIPLRNLEAGAWEALGRDPAPSMSQICGCPIQRLDNARGFVAEGRRMQMEDPQSAAWHFRLALDLLENWPSTDVVATQTRREAQAGLILTEARESPDKEPGNRDR